MTNTAPAIFFGHGNPMNALGGPYAEEWRALGQRLPRPRAVVIVSAHWMTDGLAVTAMERPPTIHDFGGFPPALHQVQYPAPGSPELAADLARRLSPEPVRQDQAWGLDHGTWSVLMHVFPQADVPIVQLSLDGRRTPEAHYALGRELSALRDEGVMIAASGDVVHNLALARLRGDAPPLDWALRFHERVKTAIEAGDHASLLAGAAISQDARRSIPTDEHWLPLLHVLGAARSGESPAFFTDSVDAAAVSMLGVAYGL